MEFIQIKNDRKTGPHVNHEKNKKQNAIISECFTDYVEMKIVQRQNIEW